MENKGGGNLQSTKVIVAANIFLILAKLTVTMLTGSIAALAVLVDSLFDLAGSLFTYYGVRKSEEPADEDHLYGHKKYESITSLVQLSLIAITALFLINEAASRLQHPVVLEITFADIGIMLFAVLVDIGIVTYLKKNARMSSPAMQASMGNYSSDILQNSLVLVSLFATGSGYYFADPLAALVVALLMLRVVYNVGKGAIGELTDAGPSKERLDGYSQAILAVKGVKSFHKLRARLVAGETHLDLHVHLDRKMQLEKAHGICTTLKHTLMEKFPEIKEVLVHPEPFTKKYAAGPKFGS